jgi:hypothetical protein
MRYLLALCTLLIVLAASDHLMAQSGQTVPAPPLTLLPLTATSTACQTSCDVIAMNCQSACVPVGPTATTTLSAPGACNNACTTQALVCKQTCR